MKLRPIKDTILVTDMERGERKLNSGIVLLSDDGKEHGVRSRWAYVYAKGPTAFKDVEVGKWILIEHGRWSRGIEIDDDTTVFRVDNDAILAIADERPENEFVKESTTHGFTKVRT